MIERVSTSRIALREVFSPYGRRSAARFERLMYWLKAVVQGRLRPGSVLINVGESFDLAVNDEHISIPPVLLDLRNLSMDTLRELTRDFSSIGETVLWEKFDWDDGFDPNDEYVIPAIAMGIIGRYIKVVFSSITGEMKNGRIAFALDNVGGVKYVYSRSRETSWGSETMLSAVVPEGEEINDKGGGRIITIPFEYLTIQDLLGNFRREEGRDYILMGLREEVPVPHTLEAIESVVQPVISG